MTGAKIEMSFSSYNQPLEIMGQRANIPGRQTFHSCKDRLRLVTCSSTLEWVGKHVLHHPSQQLRTWKALPAGHLAG